MKKRRLLNKAVGYGMALVFLSLPLLSGCTATASKEQLAMLAETRKAAEASEADLNACKQRKAELERQLAQKKQQLANLNDTRASVKQALGQ